VIVSQKGGNMAVAARKGSVLLYDEHTIADFGGKIANSVFNRMIACLTKKMGWWSGNVRCWFTGVPPVLYTFEGLLLWMETLGEEGIADKDWERWVHKEEAYRLYEVSGGSQIPVGPQPTKKRTREELVQLWRPVKVAFDKEWKVLWEKEFGRKNTQDLT
jgi:hypothetical protein